MQKPQQSTRVSVLTGEAKVLGHKSPPILGHKLRNEKFVVEPVGGYHGITAAFPTLQMIADYEEKKIQLNRGYPRFVQHPEVQYLEETVRSLYEADSVLAFTSLESALFLLIDSLARKAKTVYVEGELPSTILRFLSATAGRIPQAASRNDAEVEIVDLQKLEYGQKQTQSKEKTVIGYDDRGLPVKGCRDHCNIVVAKHPQGEAGFVILFDEAYEMFNLLRRHAGFILSSREAQRLAGNKEKTVVNPYPVLKRNIAELEGVAQDSCLLFPSGMAAVFSSIMSCLDKTRIGLVLLGSAYVDTICILEKWPALRGTKPATFVCDVEDLQAVESVVGRETAAVILEIPTNPLVRIIDLERIVEISHRCGAKVIVDNTVATPFNLNPFNYDADIVVHSTTKFLSGMNNHFGGAALSKDRGTLTALADFQDLTKSYMDVAEAEVLCSNLANFESRMRTINHNALVVAEFLSENSKIGKVYYPGLRDHPDRDLAKRYLPKGCSGLISFVLKNSNWTNAATFYDNLPPPIIKGPSLGAEQTLLCPYTLLAHYHDPADKIRQMGLDRYLFRISVGTENPASIVGALAESLNMLE